MSAGAIVGANRAFDRIGKILLHFAFSAANRANLRAEYGRSIQ